MLRLFFVLCTVAPLSFANVKSVTLLTDKNFRPYSYSEQGQVKGLYTDIVRAADELMDGYKIELTAMDWPAAKKQIQTGESFGLLSVYYHGHDWPYMYPYSLPLDTETIVTICSDKVLAKPRKTWPDDYTGLLIGNIAGYDGWLNNQVRAKSNTDVVNFLEVPTIDIAFEMVMKGNLDCALFEKTAYAFSLQLAKSRGHAQELKFPQIGTEIKSETSHLGYSEVGIKAGKYPYAYDFQKQFDNAIYQLRASGRLDEIIHQYH